MIGERSSDRVSSVSQHPITSCGPLQGSQTRASFHSMMVTALSRSRRELGSTIRIVDQSRRTKDSKPLCSCRSACVEQRQHRRCRTAVPKRLPSPDHGACFPPTPPGPDSHLPGPTAVHGAPRFALAPLRRCITAVCFLTTQTAAMAGPHEEGSPPARPRTRWPAATSPPQAPPPWSRATRPRLLSAATTASPTFRRRAARGCLPVH